MNVEIKKLIQRGALAATLATGVGTIIDLQPSAQDVVDALSPRNVYAQEAKPEAQKSWINWGYSVVGGPAGKPGEMTPLPMVSAPENLVAATMGAVEYTDKTGRHAEWTDSQKKDATYLVINEGEGISPAVPATFAWVGVSPKPNGVEALTFGQMTDLLTERSAEIRKYQPNTKNMNVLWVRDGQIVLTANFPVR